MNTTSTTTRACTFETFRDGYGGEVCKRIGVDISRLTTWDGYTQEMIKWNDEDEAYAFVKGAQRFHRVASSGERAVLHAVLAAADFTAQADKLAGGTTWDRLDGMGSRVRESVAAAILRID